MIEHADHYVLRFVEAGANSITVHVEPEAKHEVSQNLKAIRDAGCRAGLTLNPETRFELVEPFFDNIDMLLVMTVHPGFGGQPFRADQMEKVKRAAAWNQSREHKIDIEVDGGINRRDRPNLSRKRRQRPRRRHVNFSLEKLRASNS